MKFPFYHPLPEDNMLNEKEIARYNRHLILSGFGVEAQEKLKAAKVLVIGAGGLGCPILQYLSAAGVGEIGIVDFDTVDESNLQRQVLFSVSDVGKSKAETAAEKLVQQNPFVKFKVCNFRLTNKNTLALLKEFDVVIDGSDNFSTRYLVNDACVILGKPLVYGSIYKFEGQVSVFNFIDKKGELGPNYRCLFPNPPAAGSVPNCSEIGVIGVLPGIIGSLQALEAIKIITGIGSTLSGKLLLVDALQMNFQKMDLERNEDCCKNIPTTSEEYEAMDYELLCGIPSSGDEIKSISIAELQKLLIEKKKIKLLDVRELNETPFVEELGGIHIPLGEIENKMELLSREGMTVVFCRSGMRSKKAIQLLETKYKFKNLVNLEGGIMAWINHHQKK